MDLLLAIEVAANVSGVLALFLAIFSTPKKIIEAKSQRKKIVLIEATLLTASPAQGPNSETSNTTD